MASPFKYTVIEGESKKDRQRRIHRQWLKESKEKNLGFFPLTKEFFVQRCVVDVDSGCWNWIGGKVGMGYPKVYTRSGSARGNRVVWELWNGPIPDGMIVCHKCDNSGCCNPDHLFIGTHSDNMLDREIKGRACHPNINKECENCGKVFSVLHSQIKRARFCSLNCRVGFIVKCS